MKSVPDTQVVAARLPADLVRMVDDVAALKSCERSEAIRHIILVGAPLIIKAKNVNIERVLTGLEILVIDCLRKASETNPADVDMLVNAASTNVETYHV
jgi:metal-responsive CopG/Arc/MetJ family transcriptional regulator